MDSKPTVEVKRTEDGLYDIHIHGWRGLRFNAQAIIDIYEYALLHMKQLEADARREVMKHGQET